MDIKQMVEGDATQESLFESQAKIINEVMAKANLVPPPPAAEVNESSTLTAPSTPTNTNVDNDLAKRLDKLQAHQNKHEAQQEAIILAQTELVNSHINMRRSFT
uniref:Uncharacterized protein n=1 Tax=Cannabis sativa TaxID=3483 RepID=A0A803PL21_CANSA